MPPLQTNQQYRPQWDEIWMGLAIQLARRSIDPRTRVGAVVVSDDNARVLAVGYNGNERGGPNHIASVEPGMSMCIHAEENALIKLNFDYPKRKVMYVSVCPCVMCAKKLVNAQIDEVVYGYDYRTTEGLDILRRSGVRVRQFDPSLIR